jgi:hypothetical protein
MTWVWRRWTDDRRISFSFQRQKRTHQESIIDSPPALFVAPYASIREIAVAALTFRG